MCVGMVEGFSGRGDCSFEDMATWLSASNDELDIVGNATINDNALQEC